MSTRPTSHLSPREQLRTVRRLRAKHQLCEAQALLDELGARSPGDPLVEAEQVFLAVERHDPHAVGSAERLAARHPESVACWLALTEARLRAGDRQVQTRAAEAAIRATELWPSPLSFLSLARAERARGRPPEALEAVRKGLATAPKNIRLRNLEASILRDLGQVDAAARATEALPDSPMKARQQLVQALARLNPAEAETELATLAEIEPERPEVHELIGLRASKAKRHAEAADAFSRALALRPSDPYYRQMAGAELRKAGEPARAAALLRPLFLDDPLEPRVRAAFIRACCDAGDHAGLGAAIDEALARHPYAVQLHGVRQRWVPTP